MLFPYSTDAPIYFRPWGTISLIGLNTAIFALHRADVIDPRDLVLLWGDGLHPLQWASGTFLHWSLVQLLGNMCFLWVFGLVIEGKLGWVKFLPVYFLLGVAHGAALQGVTTLLQLKGFSLGPSAALFGLVAMAMVWAPENEIDLVYTFCWQPRWTSWSIRSVALLYVAYEVLLAILAWYFTSRLTSSAFDLVGAATGLLVAVVLLRRGVVDCEGWDIFSLRDGKPRETRLYRSEPAPAAASDPAEVADQRATALHLMEGYLAEGDPTLAAQTYAECVKSYGPWPLEESVLRSLVREFERAGQLPEAKPFIEELVERFPASAPSMKLLLSRVLIQHEGRPASGLSVLDSIPEHVALTEEQLRAMSELTAEARGLLDEGVLELD
ncbi:MAG TPA: rhomboid family intramembrane serine protease [Planctomycetota bacterium]|jgi:membrane associated rhomboid family serine protease|nr:rhomboid family intramembrane serine protease [Planctomycetota bacterium]